MANAKPINAAILTVSTSCSIGSAIDKSGPNLTKLLRESTSIKVDKILEKCVTDNKEIIESTLLQWCDVDEVNLILTTGGTGFAPSDVTPEATRSVITKEAPGLSYHMINKSIEVTKMAMLSRAVCGIRNITILINLPGSLKGSQECFNFISPVLPHALDLLLEDKQSVIEVHNMLSRSYDVSNEVIWKNAKEEVHVCPHGKFSSITKKYDLSKVAERDRHSRFPLMPMEEAVTTVLKHALCCSTQAFNPTQDALGYILSRDVTAKEPYPPFPASIKDGYAVVASDGPGQRFVLGPVTAGMTPDVSLRAGYVMRITTGAPIPEGSDAVVQVEDTKLIQSAAEGQSEVVIEILSDPCPGQDIRPVGFDIKQGERLLSRGDYLGPPELGLLATAGVLEVDVFNKPSVAVLSTGNELVEVDAKKIQYGQIRDCNRTTLISACRQLGYTVYDFGISEDNVESLKTKLVQCLNAADIVITSGGVSMGEKDLLKPLLQDELNASIHFGRVFMKPGKPTTFATLDYCDQKKLFFALPGNPVSALVTFHLFVHPALRKMSGFCNPQLPRIKAKLSTDVRLDSRPEFHRAHLSWRQESPFPIATSTGSQCSSRLLSMRTASALLELPPRTENRNTLPKDSLVDAIVIGNL
ncbi:gephyrin-like [Xenia sp. Carnegie-2017]|uniref:gephyrin-like n=1 Tax=Xenia sp. Carnegie-2017 TaxID=2897299 RepID=UPI001F04DCBA|nr:gephyrin-like [Xenia sp. Carnegie-2017]